MMMAGAARPCPCTNPDRSEFEWIATDKASRVLKVLHEDKDILTAEECSECAGEGLDYWYQVTAITIGTRPPDAAQLALDVVRQQSAGEENHLQKLARLLQVLSTLYQEKMVTEQELEELKQAEYVWSRLAHIQCTKPPDVVKRTAELLAEVGHDVEGKQLKVLSTLYHEKMVTELEAENLKSTVQPWDCLVQIQRTKPPDVVKRTAELLAEVGRDEEGKQLKVLSTLYQEKIVTEQEMEELNPCERPWDSLVQIQCTKPPDVVKRTAELLAEAGCDEERKSLKVLSALFQEKIVTKQGVEDFTSRQNVSLFHRLVQIQCTKPHDVVKRTAELLAEVGREQERMGLEVLSTLYQKKVIAQHDVQKWMKDAQYMLHNLIFDQCTRPSEDVATTAIVLDTVGCEKEAEILRVLSVLHQKETLKPQELDYVCFTRKHIHPAPSSAFDFTMHVMEVSGVGRELWQTLVSVQCRKPPEVVTTTAEVLDELGLKEKATVLRVMSELYQKKLITEEDIIRLLFYHHKMGCSSRPWPEYSSRHWLEYSSRHWLDTLVDYQSSKSADVHARTFDTLRRYSLTEVGKETQTKHTDVTKYQLLPSTVETLQKWGRLSEHLLSKAAICKTVHADEFVEKMNSTVLAPQLMEVDLIPGTVENGILQSKNLEEANAHLLQHLKEDADKDTVIEVFRIASEEDGYERMNTYAAAVLRELQQATFVQVIEDHTKEFLQEMNAKEIAPKLKELQVIPESVEFDIHQSKTRELANVHLLRHLQEDAAEEAVMKVFRIASEEKCYGRMNTFAAVVLKKLQQEFLAHWERPREDEDWSTVPKPDVAVTDMELQLKEEQALRHDYEVKLSAMEGEIAALKQDLKKQREQTEKWENDCMALELKYKDAQQKKEIAEKNLTNRLDFLQLESSLPATDKYTQERSQLTPLHLRKNQDDLSQPLLPPSLEKEDKAKPDVATADLKLQLKKEQALRQDYEVKLSTMEGEIAALKQDLKKQQEQKEKWESDCIALELKYTDAQQKKEEAENNLIKRLDFLQLESSLPATDPCYKYSQERSQLTSLHLRKDQADLSQPLLPPSPEKEDKATEMMEFAEEDTPLSQSVWNQYKENQTMFDRSERKLVSTLDEMQSLWQEFVRRKAADTVGDVMFHLLLRDLSQEFREKAALTKSALSLTSEEMHLWEKLRGSEVADEQVYNDQSCKQSVQTAEENQQELLARNSELKDNGQEVDKAYQSLQEELSANQELLDEQRREIAALRAQLSSLQVMEAGPVPLASDVAEGTVDENLLQQLCYMATGIKQLLISPDGGTFKLGSGDASLVFPPGAVEKETFIRYAIILHGPFVLPAGYKPGSVGVYLNMDGSTLVKPVQLFLCHWCIKQKLKEDDVTLKFIRAPHTLEVGVQEYTYEELEEEADFTTYTNVGVLTIRELRCLYCVETKVETIAKYSAITLTRNVPSDETLFFRIQLMCDSLEWSTKLTGLLDDWGWKHGSSGIVPRFSYSSPEKPIEACAAKSEGLGWVATIEGQHQVNEADFLIPKGKSKSDMEKEVNSGRFPPCLCYKIQYTSPEERRVSHALLKVDLFGADVRLTFSCTLREEPKLSVPSPVSSGPSLSAETPRSSPQRTIHLTAESTTSDPLETFLPSHAMTSSSHHPTKTLEGPQTLSKHPLVKESPLTSTPEELSVSPPKIKVSRLQAGGGSDPPEREDTSNLLTDEAALKRLCWIPFDIRTVSIEAKGGVLCLEPTSDDLQGMKEDTICVEVPPDAVSTSDNVKMRYAVIPSGPFTLPEGYQFGSPVVYIYYDRRHVTKPLTLHLPHWYGGKDHAKDGLSFAIAPHSLKGGSVYHFQLLAGGKFSVSSRYGAVEIGGHCSLFTKVFKLGTTENYQAVCLEKEEGRETVCDIAVTYAITNWLKILKKYRPGWKLMKSSSFIFKSDRITATFKQSCHDDWHAVFRGPSELLSRQVRYDCHSITSSKLLEEAVKESSYPPSITCVITCVHNEELRSTGRPTEVGLHIRGMDPEMEFQCTAYERIQVAPPPHTPGSSPAPPPPILSLAQTETTSQPSLSVWEAALAPPPHTPGPAQTETTSQPQPSVSLWEAARKSPPPPTMGRPEAGATSQPSMSSTHAAAVSPTPLSPAQCPPIGTAGSLSVCSPTTRVASLSPSRFPPTHAESTLSVCSPHSEASSFAPPPHTPGPAQTEATSQPQPSVSLWEAAQSPPPPTMGRPEAGATSQPNMSSTHAAAVSPTPLSPAQCSPTGTAGSLSVCSPTTRVASFAPPPHTPGPAQTEATSQPQPSVSLWEAALLTPPPVNLAQSTHTGAAHTLSVCSPHSEASSSEFLDHFRQQFIAEVDASTIVLELEHRGIISDGDQKTIRQEVKATLQAQLLHACLKKTCDAKALTDVCDIIATVKGNPRMKSFGEHMKTEWEKVSQKPSRQEPPTGPQSGDSLWMDTVD